MESLSNCVYAKSLVIAVYTCVVQINLVHLLTSPYMMPDFCLFVFFVTMIVHETDKKCKYLPVYNTYNTHIEYKYCKSNSVLTHASLKTHLCIHEGYCIAQHYTLQVYLTNGPVSAHK